MIKELWNNRYTTLIKLFTIINIILFEVNVGLWIRSGQEHLFAWADFTSLYNSFVKMRAQYVGKLYDLHTIFQHGILGSFNLDSGVYPLHYPPIISFVYWPLSFLPFTVAFIIWTIIEVGLLIWLLYLLVHLFSEWNKSERLVLIITILAFFPLAHTILAGQFSLFLVICLVQIYISLTKDKPIKAGIWMALLLIKPPMVLIPGFILLNKRLWRGAVSAAITFVLLFILSSLLFGLEPWIKYLQLLVNMNINIGNYPFQLEAEYTFRGLLSRILGNAQTGFITLLSNAALLLGMALILYFWFTKILINHPRIKLYFAFTITISAFLSLHMYTHDDLILVLSIAIFYDYLRQMGFKRQAYSILVLISPLVFFIGYFTSVNLFGFLLLPSAIIVLLLGWIIAYMIQDYRIEHLHRTSSNIASFPMVQK
jgi:hypothetical protein